MANDQSEKEKPLKKSGYSPDQAKKEKRRKKNEKKRSKKLPKASLHDSSSRDASPVSAKSEMKLGEDSATCTGDKRGIDGVTSNAKISGGWSWGAAFAAASKIQPTDLGENFIKATSSTTFDSADDENGEKDGVAVVSHLAHEYTIRKFRPSDSLMTVGDVLERTSKRKWQETSEVSDAANDDVSSGNFDDTSLEGRMVHISSSDGREEMTLVLVSKQGKVYSSGRTHDGRRLIIGTVVDGKIQLDPSAVENMSRLEEKQSTKLGPAFPYPTNPDDHCETPLQSYKDILPILNDLSKKYGGKRQDVKIYDPYFCDGSVVKNLSSLGFSSVYNKKEDCYAVWESNSAPHYDVLITNPPYSEDHLEKLMNHVTSSSFGDKPWLLLMPQWVHKKNYYANAISKKSSTNNPCNPFYIVPKKRYVYLPPANFREKKESDVHKKSSPFVSMWYCWGGDEKKNEDLMNAFRRSSAIVDCDLARSKNALRDLRRVGGKGAKKL